MTGEFEDLKKPRPADIARDLLETKLNIKRPLRNDDHVSVTGESTLRNFLADYLKCDERMNLLSVNITAADEAGDEAEAGRLRNIEGWLTALPLGAEPGTDEERRHVQEALTYRDEVLDPGLTLPQVARVVEKVARGEKLSGHPLLNDKDLLADGIELLKELKEEKETGIAIYQSPEFREMIGDMTRGVEEILADGSEQVDMLDAIQRGGAVPPDPDQQETITIGTVKWQQRTRAEIEIIDRITDKLVQLGEALGLGRKR